jgi:prepilin-type processing-associated H-X9-DG protein
MLLPFMEQGALYNSINFNTVAENSNDGFFANWTGGAARINGFLCPSSPLPQGNDWDTFNGAVPYPGNNYFASTGSSLSYDATDNPNGLFWQDNGGGHALSITDVTDGTSNSVAFGEWRMGDFNPNQLSIQDVIDVGSFPPGTWWGAPSLNMPLGAQPFLQWLNTCAGTAQTTIGNSDLLASTIGRNWRQGTFALSLGNLLLPPNSQWPNCNTRNYHPGDIGDSPGMYGLSSYHPGGAMTAMADGSVHFLKSSTNMRTIWSLGSRNQGEVIDANSY